MDKKIFGHNISANKLSNTLDLSAEEIQGGKERSDGINPFHNRTLAQIRMKFSQCLCFICGLCVACNDYTPKPSGYLRIETGANGYQDYTKSPIFAFEYSNKATIVPLPSEKGGEWFNISYPEFQANIHCSSLPVKPETLVLAAEDSRKFVYRHTIKADDIISQYFENPDKQVYGTLYEIKGNVASPLQFTLTDSVRHFFRGAVYFNTVPNQDSIAPVLDFVKKDVVRLMDSFVFRSKR